MRSSGRKREQWLESLSYRLSLADLRNRKKASVAGEKVFQDEVGGLSRGWVIYLVDLSKEWKFFSTM